MVLSGVLIGFINGFLGGGGGVLVVVVLLSVLGYDQHKAQATAMLIILPVSFVSAVVYIIGQSVQWLETLFATIGVMIGGIIGALLLKKISGKNLKAAFALIMVFGGIKMLFS